MPSEDISGTLNAIQRMAEKNELRIALIEVAIREMDDAQRLRLDRLLETLKNISNMSNWCALAALFYVVSTIVKYFR